MVDFFASSGIFDQGGGLVKAFLDPFGEDLSRVAGLLDAVYPGFCVVDSYEASPSVLDTLRALVPLVVIDDLRRFPVEEHCEAVLNYGFRAPKMGYKGIGNLLLGPRYALLREQFWDVEKRPGARHLVVSGAADPLGVTPKLIRWWREFDLPGADFVIGPMVDHELRKAAEEEAGRASHVRLIRAPRDLPLIMANSRAVICTSSVTAYEALGLEKPVVVFQVADNQVETGQAIEDMGLGVNLGPWGSWGAKDLLRALNAMFAPPAGVVNPRGAVVAAMELLKAFRIDPTHGI
jgi:spore coat polysaccharide biosynthesis predicted glycosyltransferase SpsG